MLSFFLMSVVLRNFVEPYRRASPGAVSKPRQPLGRHDADDVREAALPAAAALLHRGEPPARSLIAVCTVVQTPALAAMASMRSAAVSPCVNRAARAGGNGAAPAWRLAPVYASPL
jgi:hypothetical protein